MSRPSGGREAMVLVAILAAGCQDYNFNPVGQCVIQPGSQRVTLSSISTADVLFVVDDSGSMGAEQQLLAQNFNAFITNLDQANATRVANGLEPFDFHIAVTSSSVFWNYQTGATCRSDCPDAAGSLVCCNGSTAVRQPRACTPGVTTCPGATTCRTNCAGLLGEPYCCNADGSYASPLPDVVPCSRAGTLCGTFERHYDFSGSCVPGVGVDGWPYPRGDFVSWTSGTTAGSTANPRVLHFDKQLYTGGASGTNRQGFTRQELINFFSGGGGVQGNVITGTCGSGEEQALSAARLAVERAVAGQQADTYGIGAGKVATWDPVTRVASSTAEWLHPNSKLVLVFVGDEDDCSSPPDPSGGVVMFGSDFPGSDACTRDQDDANPAPNGRKLYDVVSQFVEYFAGLGRPLGAAFIESAAQTSCQGTQCTPGTCCQPDCPTAGTCGRTAVCGGQAAGTRLFQVAGELRGRGADVVQGSICDPAFDVILQQIAEIVKPPSGLTLPTRPAESAITLLRIADAGGKTRKVCGRPLAPGSYGGLAAAQATGADWWFTETRDPGVPAALSRYVYINPQGRCIANPGETYSADYLGQLPEGGCRADAECAQKLGGAEGAWTCFSGMQGSGQCVDPGTSAEPGTCLCGARSKNCPNG